MTDIMGMDNRKVILMNALLIEVYVSDTLKYLLQVKKDNISFGNTGNNLGFDQKLNLLLDLKAIDTKIQGSFRHFMYIRNQAVHNYEAKTYSDYVLHNPNLKKYLLKYPDLEDEPDEESKLKAAILELAHQCIKYTQHLAAVIIKDIQKTITTSMDAASLKAYDRTVETIKTKAVDDMFSITEFKKIFDEYWNEEKLNISHPYDL